MTLFDLLALAEKATPGPWTATCVDEETDTEPSLWRIHGGDTSHEATLCELWSGEHDNAACATYIAACSPEVVAALVKCIIANTATHCPICKRAYVDGGHEKCYQPAAEPPRCNYYDGTIPVPPEEPDLTPEQAAAMFAPRHALRAGDGSAADPAAIVARLRESIPWEQTTRGDRPTLQLWEDHALAIDAQREQAAAMLTAMARERDMADDLLEISRTQRDKAEAERDMANDLLDISRTQRTKAEAALEAMARERDSAGACCDSYAIENQQFHDRFTKAEAAAAASAKDAERYRWIRENGYAFPDYASVLPAETLDARVDAAIDAQKGEG